MATENIDGDIDCNNDDKLLWLITVGFKALPQFGDADQGLPTTKMYENSNLGVETLGPSAAQQRAPTTTGVVVLKGCEDNAA